MLALLLSLAGCSAATEMSSPSVHQALEIAESAGEAARPAAQVRTHSSFGYQAPYVPLVIPPDVRRVWVPTHVNEEGELIQGHWVFLRLTGWQWFTESPQPPGRTLGVPVPPNASPPPWPAPTRAGRRTIVPWVENAAEPAPPPPATAPAPSAPAESPGAPPPAAPPLQDSTGQP